MAGGREERWRREVGQCPGASCCGRWRRRGTDRPADSAAPDPAQSRVLDERLTSENNL